MNEMPSWLTIARLVAFVSVTCGAGTAHATEAGSAAERLFAKSAQSPLELRAFIHAMPKGAELHYHLVGGSYAENRIKIGAAQGSCIDIDTLAAVRPPCDSSRRLRPMSSALRDFDFYQSIVDAWSMRDYVPNARVNGHDKFFKTFELFEDATDLGAILSEVSNRAAGEKLSYLELMISLETQAIRQLASRIARVEDFDAMRTKLMIAGMDRYLDNAVSILNQIESEKNRILKCDEHAAEPGCKVYMRYLVSTIRTEPPETVFAQTLFGFLLAERDSRVVGINFVGPEDHPIALADYSLHMDMLKHLETRMPNVKVALHAGELTLGQVSPEDLRFHIREAVLTGGARRIGHGVDVAYEDRSSELLRMLAEQHIAVEVALTSSRVILGAVGKQHPFDIYRRFNVPIVIATDDEGVSRTDLTNELVTAVTSYGLTFNDLVSLQRNSLEYSFLPGQSLWEVPGKWRVVQPCQGDRLDQPSSACSEFLKKSKKAELQWEYERRLENFETSPE
jgi:Adenosine deaminase